MKRKSRVFVVNYFVNFEAPDCENMFVYNFSKKKRNRTIIGKNYFEYFQYFNDRRRYYARVYCRDLNEQKKTFFFKKTKLESKLSKI